MEKLFALIFATLIFVACSKDDLPEENEASIAITFGELETRAEVSSPDDILEFGVYGKMSNQDASSSYTDIFTNERVYRSDESAVWDYDHTRYWMDGRTYHFFGVYPYENSLDRIQTAILEQNNKNYDGFQIAFTTPTTADMDLMTAFATVTAQAPSYDFVNLEFSHALSKIMIKIAKNSANSANKVVVTSVSLSGIKKSGVYYCSREYGYTNHWAVVDEEKLITISNINMNYELTTTLTSVLGLDKGWLLIPQDIAENSLKLTIKYSFYYVDGAFAYENTIERVIPTNQINEWEPNTNYVYSVNLSAESNDITFGTPTISEWGAAQSSGTIIIK